MFCPPSPRKRTISATTTEKMSQEILDQIDVLVREIPIADYSVKGVNCLLPCDCSQDVKKLIAPLLIELKEFLNTKDYDSYKFDYFLVEKFEA